jgi:hypothetical protein
MNDEPGLYDDEALDSHQASRRIAALYLGAGCGVGETAILVGVDRRSIFALEARGRLPGHGG